MASVTGGPRSRTGGRRTFQARSDVNITPLVDVMLVLMIIFMVTAPMLTVGVPVNLPKASAPAASSQSEPIIISVNAEGKIFLHETEVTMESLGPQLSLITQNNAEAPLFVRGDQTVSYGTIVTLMAAMAEAGYSKVALLAESSQPKSPKKAP